MPPGWLTGYFDVLDTNMQTELVQLLQGKIDLSMQSNTTVGDSALTDPDRNCHHSIACTLSLGSYRVAGGLQRLSESRVLFAFPRLLYWVIVSAQPTHISFYYQLRTDATIVFFLCDPLRPVGGVMDIDGVNPAEQGPSVASFDLKQGTIDAPSIDDSLAQMSRVVLIESCFTFSNHADADTNRSSRRIRQRIRKAHLFL